MSFSILAVHLFIVFFSISVLCVQRRVHFTQKQMQSSQNGSAIHAISVCMCLYKSTMYLDNPCLCSAHEVCNSLVLPQEGRIGL